METGNMDEEKIEAEVEEQEAGPSVEEDGPELFDESYMEVNKKPPPLLLLGLIVLLILSVFWKKFIGTYRIEHNAPQVEVFEPQNQWK